MSAELRQSDHSWYVTMSWGVKIAWGSDLNHSQSFFVLTTKMDYRQAVRAAKKMCKRKSAVVTGISYRGAGRLT